MPEVMKTVGRYEILRELGRGGMALVYLARQTDLDRFVALKELGAFHASDPSFAQRFIRESRVAGSLSHPNIVTVHDYFEHDGTPYIAMEYVDRGSLRPYVGTMTLAQVGGVCEGLLAGLAAAEAHGIVHRDLKPENLMVTSDGRVKIADFGIAKATQASQTGAFLTATGTTVGTPTYMAPEQAMAQEVGPWTDLYSVGCMAFEMFTGKPPFHDSEAPMAILLRHVNEPIPRASTLADVDEEIADWIERLVVKDPKQRVQSAMQAWDEFEEIIIGQLGPRWRRQARLTATPGSSTEAVTPPPPLTPAPFEGTDGQPPQDEFQSFAWGKAAEAGVGGPESTTPPPVEAAPSPPAPTPPPTPTPGPATPPPVEAAEQTGFVTFGAPKAAPAPEPAAPPVAAAPPAPPAEQAPPPVEQAPPPVEQQPPAFEPIPHEPPPPAAPEPPTVEEEPGFETYVAPTPMRPSVAQPPPAPAPPPAHDPAPVAAAPPAPVPPPPPAPVPAPEIAATVMPPKVREVAPPPPRVSKPAKEPPKERSLVPFLVAAVVVLAVIGFLIGGSGGGGEEPASFTTPQANSDVEIKTPATWKKGGDVPPVPGLDALAEPVVVTSSGQPAGVVVAGMAGEESANFSLLPNEAVKALGEVPEHDAVRLTGSKLQAFRYTGIDAGGASVTVYVAPTSAGVATVVCSGVSAGDCEGVANTLRLAGGAEPFPVGPSSEYADTLKSVLEDLDAAVKKARSGVAGSRPGRQAGPAAAASAAYSKAAGTLGEQELSPADQSANKLLIAAFSSAAKAWKGLSNAARRGDRAGYRRAQTAIKKAEDQINRAFLGAEAAGYKQS